MTIEERFEMLEAELAAARRLTRRLMFGAGIFFGMFVLFVSVRTITGVAHGQAKETVIRATRFIVEDSNGRQRAMFGMNQGWPGLHIGYGAGGAPLVALSSRMPNIYLADERGTPRIKLSVIGERPSLEMFSRNRMDLVDLNLSLGKPGLTLTDEKGNVLWQVP